MEMSKDLVSQQKRRATPTQVRMYSFSFPHAVTSAADVQAGVQSHPTVLKQRMKLSTAQTNCYTGFVFQVNILL